MRFELMLRLFIRVFTSFFSMRDISGNRVRGLIMNWELVVRRRPCVANLTVPWQKPAIAFRKYWRSFTTLYPANLFKRFPWFNCFRSRYFRVSRFSLFFCEVDRVRFRGATFSLSKMGFEESICCVSRWHRKKDVHSICYFYSLHLARTFARTNRAWSPTLRGISLLY